jgi:hypothetical protein
MSGEEVDRAVKRVEARRPDLGAAVEGVAGGLTAGEGADVIHQAALQEFLWWHVPRDYPDDEWQGVVEATAELLDELGMKNLASVARSEVTGRVLAAWRQGDDKGAAAFQAADAKSGVRPPDTPLLAWGSIMGMDEAGARGVVERALGDAVAAGDLVPGASGWQAKAAALTEALLNRPLDFPPGQTLLGLITTERIGTWIDAARHPVHRAWRSGVANGLLHPIEPPASPGDAVAPMRWLLECAAMPGGGELTQNNYLARATVVAAVERFGWWDWEKPPRSEADVPELMTLRGAANRLRLLRRRGRRLHLTTRGANLLDAPDHLWEQVATETEDGEEFTRTVTELVGLRLLRGRVEQDELVAELAPVLAAQGWATRAGPITPDQVSSAVWRPKRWWRIFGVLDEEKSRWERGTGRRLTPDTIALTSEGERMVLAFLRARASGPRHTVPGL